MITKEDGKLIHAFIEKRFTAIKTLKSIQDKNIKIFTDEVLSLFRDGFTGKSGPPPRYVLILCLAFLEAAERVNPNPPGSQSSRGAFKLSDFIADIDATSPKFKDLSNQTVVSIRTTYETIHSFFYNDLKRTDAPYGPQQATNSWKNFLGLVEQALRMTSAQRKAAFQALTNFGAETYLANRFFQQEKRIRLYDLILTSYDRTAPRTSAERPGTAMQAIAYGFIAADRRHLDISVDKVGGGSKRQRRIGDIDCYRGLIPELTVEVKDMDLKLVDLENPRGLGQFITNVVESGIQALAIVAGTVEAENTEIRKLLTSSGITLLTLEDLASTTNTWDWAKQDVATQATLHYLSHIEQKQDAVQRLIDFLRQHDPNHESVKQEQPKP